MPEPGTARFVYHGPNVYVAVLDREISDGDTVEGPDNLACNAGFERQDKPQARKQEPSQGDED